MNALNQLAGGGGGFNQFEALKKKGLLEAVG